MLQDAPEVQRVVDSVVQLTFGCDHAALLLHDDVRFRVE